jgi:hypothetical protein
MMKDTRKIRTCYVSAPRGISLDILRQSLLAHDIRPLIPEELSAATDWASELQQQLVQADLVIGILPTGRQSAWVPFRVGTSLGSWAVDSRYCASRIGTDASYISAFARFANFPRQSAGD